MISSLVRNTVHKPVAVIMITILVVVFGCGSLFFLPMNFYPPISVPKITIATTYNGLPAKEVQELLTIPIEDTVSSLQGLKKITSSSLDGISIIELSFAWGTDIRQTGIQTREMADLAALELPEGAAKPMVLPVNPTEKPILIIGAFPKGTMEITGLKRLCDREIKSMIQQASGVGSVQILGGLDEEILIEPDPHRLGVYSIPLQSIAQAIQSTNTEVPAGSIEQGTTEYIVKTESMVRSASDINEIPLFTGNDASGTIFIRDLAEVRNATADRNSFVIKDSVEGIGILVRAQGGFSPVSLSKNVREKISDIQTAYGSSLKLEVLSDTSEMISESIRDLLFSAMAGVLVAFLVIIAFLKKLTSSLIMTISIPLSLLSAIALFPFAGIGINTMSIGGLAIGIGMLVDNSVVVLENLQRKADPDNRESVVAATVEIAGSTIGSTITSLIVFLPLFFLPGIIGVVFRDLAWAVSFSLLASFVVSISVVPVLFCRLGSTEKANTGNNARYRDSLRKVYRHPALAAIGCAFLLCIGSFSFFFLEKNWLDTPETNHYVVSISLPAGLSIEHQLDIAKKTATILSGHSEIGESFFYAGGDYGDPYYITGKDPEHETIFCHISTTANAHMDTEKATVFFTSLFSTIGNASVSVTSASLSFNDILGFGGKNHATFPVPGKDYEEAFSRAVQFRDAYNDPDISVYPRSSRPRIIAKPKRDAIDALHLDNASIAQILGSYIFGVYAGSLESPNGRIPIKIRLGKEHRSSPDTLVKLTFPLSENTSTTLAEAISMEKTAAPPVYYRNNRQHVAYLDIPMKNQAARDKTGLVVTDTETEEWKSQSRTILFLFCISIFLMYILLGIQFNSFLLPLLLLAVIPFGFAGVFAALFISCKAITLNGILGSLVVIGVVVNNGIIFYDNFSSRISNSRISVLGTYRGANDRIRAITISFFTTFIALIPIAIDITKKNPQSAMATAIIGGILASTLVSIYGFPVVFNLYFRRKLQKDPHVA